ncbi:hypothetical protein SAMN04515674_105309 [Pseudarcicella hirudinis]|uniref:Uncharacterized protein n=1 Tax=Pseudarcicella hirudinis TaxID=1079859 RepID=A0A1I5T0H5_9BACT|nr:hypothetical protein SAMN04515674_105309 [Pseudarcicella hirudinis]
MFFLTRLGAENARILYETKLLLEGRLENSEKVIKALTIQNDSLMSHIERNSRENAWLKVRVNYLEKEQEIGNFRILGIKINKPKAENWAWRTIALMAFFKALKVF